MCNEAGDEALEGENSERYDYPWYSGIPIVLRCCKIS
jgi:hypothetical protein